MNIFNLSDEQISSIQSEGWAIEKEDINCQKLALTCVAGDVPFLSAQSIFVNLINKTKNGSCLHGYIVNAIKDKYPDQFNLLAKDIDGIPVAEDNYKKVFIICDASDAFVYSDNCQWASIDGELCIDNKDGFPVWPEGEPANGDFTDEDFLLKRTLMIAASNAYSLIEDNKFRLPNDFSFIDDERESILSLSQVYASDLSEITDIDYDKAVSLITTHLEGVIPES